MLARPVGAGDRQKGCRGGGDPGFQLWHKKPNIGNMVRDMGMASCGGRWEPHVW